MRADDDGGTGTKARFALTESDESELRVLAENVLRQSFEILTDESVLPRSRYRPWIQMARDYFGHAVEVDGPLSEALKMAIPERFEGRLLDEAMDWSGSYSHALLEGAVAAATFADEPYEVSSPSVQNVINQFIDKIKATPATTVLQVITDVDVTTEATDERGTASLGQTLRIGEVEIVRVGGNAEKYIERELRSAGYEVERENVINMPGPTSLLIARVSEPISISERTRAAHRRLRNLTTAIRLGTGATLSPLVTIEGEPGDVRTSSPHIQPHAVQMMRLGNREVALGPDDVPGTRTLAERVNDWFDGGELETNPLMLAVGRMNRSIGGRSTTYADIVTDLAIGLEAAFGGAGRSEVSLRLRTRAADLLSTGNDPADRIYQDVKELYQLRSNIVHGRGPKARDFEKSIGRVSSATRSSHFGEQILLALDRWRDILRRAILARAALSVGSTLWPFDSGLDIERILRSPTERDKWVGQIHSYWDDVGLDSALEPAAPWKLRFTAGENQPSSGE